MRLTLKQFWAFMDDTLGLTASSPESVVHDTHISNEQMYLICEHLDNIPYFIMLYLVTHPGMTEFHVDMLVNTERTVLLEELVDSCPATKPRHLEILMAHTYLRFAILNHPLCTDAMRVNFHLKGLV